MSSGDPLDSITDWPMASQQTATELLSPYLSAWITHLILFGLVQSEFSAYTSTDLYKNDPKRVKLLLWTVVAIDLASTCLNAEQMFHYGTTQHRDHATLYVVRPSDAVPIWLGALTALLVQGFLLRRASTMFSHHLLRRYLFICVLSFLALLSFLAACGSFVIGVLWGYSLGWLALPFTYMNLTSTWLMTTLAVDFSLCLTLVVLLRTSGFNTSLPNSPVRKLINTTIQSAALPALFGLAGAITSFLPQATDKTKDVPLFWTIPLSPLYALALVGTLAGRTPHTPALVTGTCLNMGDVLGPNSGTGFGSMSGKGGIELGMRRGSRLRGSFIVARGAEEDGDDDEAEKDKEAALLEEGEESHRQIRLDPRLVGLGAVGKGGCDLVRDGEEDDDEERQGIRWA